MNYYIGQTVSQPIFLELHIFKFHMRYILENHNMSGFGLFDEMDNLVKTFGSYNEAVNYCEDNCLNLTEL